jgi:hypothetical protein
MDMVEQEEMQEEETQPLALEIDELEPRIVPQVGWGC